MVQYKPKLSTYAELEGGTSTTNSTGFTERCLRMQKAPPLAFMLGLISQQLGVIESLRAFRLLDTVDSAVVPVELYRIAIAKPDQVLSGNVYWAVSVSWLLEAIIEGIVRMFYCFRVWKVSGNKKLGCAIVFSDYLL
ncbi:hypothetical protein K435DRAFT_796564 [Dendrothele bispora CBS 962.96]|uniref:Uncharacterized protein n=1 Tax=Dendrothele bispora (strain CBS 962.96) TaxID=1314807 RepID=A0A4S8M558_DENBC|nr:hypothetical protein K435DRAFT_796564 [Dendrothele bispora CBS 962.96]